MALLMQQQIPSQGQDSRQDLIENSPYQQSQQDQSKKLSDTKFDLQSNSKIKRLQDQITKIQKAQQQLNSKAQLIKKQQPLNTRLQLIARPRSNRSNRSNRSSHSKRSLSKAPQLLKNEPNIKLKLTISTEAYCKGLQKDLPSDQHHINCLQSLAKDLQKMTNFTVLEIRNQNKQIGEVVAVRLQERVGFRVLIAWDNKNLFDVFKMVSEFVFERDPAKQIQFRMFYRPSELPLFNAFEKQFSKIGSIFQKKLGEGLIQHRYLHIRPFHLIYGGKALTDNSSWSSLNCYIRVLSADLALKTKTKSVPANTYNKRYAIFPQASELLSLGYTDFVDEAGLLANSTLTAIKALKKQPSRHPQLFFLKAKNVVELNRQLITHGLQTEQQVKDPSSIHYDLNFSELLFGEGLVEPRVTTLEVGGRKVRYHVLGMQFGRYATVQSTLYASKMVTLQGKQPFQKVFVMAGEEYARSFASMANKEQDLHSYLAKFLLNRAEQAPLDINALWLPMFRVSQQSAFHWFGRQLYAQAEISCHSEYYLAMSRREAPAIDDWVCDATTIVGVLDERAASGVLWAVALEPADLMAQSM